MPADRLLNTVLGAYQHAPNPAETDKIFGTTAHLLSNLTNPLNLSLLTSHFLTARSIWEAPEGLRTCLRIISVYNTAAIRVRQNEVDNAQLAPGEPLVGGGVGCEAWARAVSKGADERSSRWKHVLVLAGILMGMEDEDRRSLSYSLRSTLEQAVTAAANLALQDPLHTGPLGSGAVVLALAYAFPLISEPNKQLLNCTALVPAVVEAMVADEGFHNSDFIQAITNDVKPEQNLWWNANSPSTVYLQQLVSRPLVHNMGPLSRLAAFAVQHASDSAVILDAQDRVLHFTTVLVERWGFCALSRLDDLSGNFPREALQGPWTALWNLLKKIMYTVVAFLQPLVGRSLLDPRLCNNITSPLVASKTLRTLYNLSFISSRQGASSFQVYTFTYLTSLDILARYPPACEAFLQKAQPPSPQVARAPTPLTQALTLFYLNVAEHLTLSLPTAVCEALIITPATAHLAPTSWLTSEANSTHPSSLTLELFESSHSAILSVFSCPQHSPLTATIIPFYIDTLLASFPTRISPRQFRLAFKTVMQIASPPFPIAASHPDLAETLLEMLRYRASPAGGASTIPLILPDESPAHNEHPQQQQQTKEPPPALSEQSTLVLSMIDSLPFLPLHLVHDWLSRTADSMNGIVGGERGERNDLREVARRRYWDVLVSGEMDVERAAIGVAWWGTRGGREMVLFGRPSESFLPGQQQQQQQQQVVDDSPMMMSGALPPGEQENDNTSTAPSSKL